MHDRSGHRADIGLRLTPAIDLRRQEEEGLFAFRVVEARQCQRTADGASELVHDEVRACTGDRKVVRRIKL